MDPVHPVIERTRESDVNKPYHETERVSLFHDVAVWSLTMGILVSIVGIGIAVAIYLPGRWQISWYEDFYPVWRFLAGLNLVADMMAMLGLAFSILAYFEQDCRRTLAATGITTNGSGCLIQLMLLYVLSVIYT
jgi:hypothetical protein